MVDPVELLARGDKWSLSAGDGILFAPSCPQWLDVPGFWDEATIHQWSMSPLFSVVALDADGRELVMRPVSRRWTPAELTVEYRLSNGMMASEVRTVQPGGIFASEWLVQGMRDAEVHLVAFTAQDATAIARDSVRWTGALSFTRTLDDDRTAPLAVTGELACIGGTTSWGAFLAESGAARPHWHCTPFLETWSSDGLPRELRVEGVSRPGTMYAAVHRELRVTHEGASTAFALRVTPADPALAAVDAGSGAHGATLGSASRRRWREMFASVPGFRCSDPYLERYYWYRWYGLFSSAVAPGAGSFEHPTVCAGIGASHAPLARLAYGHARELRWLDSPDRARGVLRTFFRHQREDGSLPARIELNRVGESHDLHGNWGDALLALDDVWPDDAFLRELFPSLVRYADWLARTRDASGSGMLDLAAPHEGGEQHAPRYQSLGSPSDDVPRLKGIDATVHAYALFRALERVAARIGNPPEERRWRLARERVERAVRCMMWDRDTEMFFDVNPATGERTGVKSAVCFYPYATELAVDEHLAGLERHLLDPAEFWTPFPVPSMSVDDPSFSAYAEWKGRRRSRPWNGRVWPIANSQLVDALATTAIARAPHLREHAVTLLRRFVRMMFHDGDLARPNSHEHYNPLTGHASVYRGHDDCQHSWIADHIISLVMGVRPHAGGITIDPFPFGLEAAELTGLRARGRTLDVRIAGARVTVTVDGAMRETTIGVPLELPG